MAKNWLGCATAKTRVIFSLALVTLLLSLSEGKDWYISPFGSDQTGTGTINNPLQTIVGALTYVAKNGNDRIVLMKVPNFLFL
jgi:hypothetical protein